MIRAVLYLFLAIILITFLRSVIGLIARAFAGLAAGDAASASHPGGSKSAGKANVGELKRDPVCGTYVAESASIKQLVGGEVVHFCSEACRAKYRPN